MIGTDTISRVIGQDVYDESGQKIGSASEVYLDDETGQPEWLTVKTGLFGTKESFVPIRDADRSEEHTSELQSRQYLVCRLLLEKKKSIHAPLYHCLFLFD